AAGSREPPAARDLPARAPARPGQPPARHAPAAQRGGRFPGPDHGRPLRRGLAPGRPRAAQAAGRALGAARALIATARARRSRDGVRALQDEDMNETRPRWAWLFFAQLALVVFACVMATAGHFPTVLFRPPIDKLGHFF